MTSRPLISLILLSSACESGTYCATGARTSQIRVGCLDTSLDLSISIDEVSGAVTDVAAALPNVAGGTCRQ